MQILFRTMYDIRNFPLKHFSLVAEFYTEPSYNKGFLFQKLPLIVLGYFEHNFMIKSKLIFVILFMSLYLISDLPTDRSKLPSIVLPFIIK